MVPKFTYTKADAPTNAVVYKGLQTNLPTAVMQSPDLDFAPGLPSYVSKPQLGAYIARYAELQSFVGALEKGGTATRAFLATDRLLHVKAALAVHAKDFKTAITTLTSNCFPTYGSLRADLIQVRANPLPHAPCPGPNAGMPRASLAGAASPICACV